MIVFPNAKINIGLNVVEKRDDGFHNIESIFYPIPTLNDILEIVPSTYLGCHFSSTGIDIPGSEEGNLCVKAYKLLQDKIDSPGVKIHLHKSIPIGAGLGGGSSDAAHTLIALNDMFNINLTKDQLMNFAKELGSDCAFFIENNPVYAFQKGDEFEAIDIDLSSYEIKIEYPEIHVGTPEAYSGVIPDFPKENLKELVKQPIEEWKSSIKNDFEKSIFSQYPSIKELKHKMYADGAVFASMTGSGSAVFGIFNK